MSPKASTLDGNQSADEFKRELAEAREQQAATGEILRVISSSPMDLQRVFAEIAASAARLCDAYDAVIFQVEGDLLRLVAHDGLISTPSTLAVTREVSPSRAVLERRTIHVADLQAETDEYPEGSDRARRFGVRTVLNVPLIRAGKAVGVIGIRRTEVRLFSDKQVALLETFANQAVIAIENTRLFEQVQSRTMELTESLESQTATSDILNVISRSPTDVQPVFDTIAANAVKLCSATFSVVLRFDGEMIEIASLHNVRDVEGIEAFRRAHPRRPVPGGATDDAILTRTIRHIPDVLDDGAYPHQPLAQATSYRSLLSMPMLRHGTPVGVITVAGASPRMFTERHVNLLTIFAEQAVIALENTRLFEEVQSRTRELTEALEQQTATADVLKVISRSALDVQKVLDALVESAARLCNAYDASIWQVLGDSVRLVAHHGQIPTPGPVLSLVRGLIGGRAIIDRRAVHVADILAEADEYPETRKNALRHGYRTVLAVPLVHAGMAIGVILIRRAEVRPFTERQIELVSTFADQAVIAIENTRLFEAEQVRTRELHESLEYQTATGEVLGVISRSPSRIDLVFETIIAIAERLCQADFGFAYRRGSDSRFHFVAAPKAPEQYVLYRKQNPVTPGDDSIMGRALSERRAISVADVKSDSVTTETDAHRLGRIRSALAVPLMNEGEPVGVIGVVRSMPDPFSNRQIELVKTFADQAVIAIENARLFEEVQARTGELAEALKYQTAISEVLGVISRSKFALQPVLETLLATAAKLCDADHATVRRREGEDFVVAATYGISQFQRHYFERSPTRPDRTSIYGRAVIEGRTVHFPDILADAEYKRPGLQAVLSNRAGIGVPLLRDGTVIGVFALARREPRPFTQKQIELVETFADQAVIAIENTRLFEEVQARTGELAKTVEDLEIASQHKSQFVANMSHELRTPLAAILGYAELIQEGFYGELPEKSMDALTRIRSNGKHLLSLINTVLDIAKIESGQFTLNMAEYAIESIVETVRSATESLAQNKKLALTTEVAKSLPIGLGDEQRLTQVLLNLVGNAIKFTDTGEVRVTAKAVNGHFNVSVTDTGPGIPEHERARIFEQFHQVDSSLTKAKGGTGLGLAIAKQIVEMHGGRIWVESALGKGSTFQMELPTRAEFQKRAP